MKKLLTGTLFVSEVAAVQQELGMYTKVFLELMEEEPERFPAEYVIQELKKELEKLLKAKYERIG